MGVSGSGRPQICSIKRVVIEGFDAAFKDDKAVDDGDVFDFFASGLRLHECQQCVFEQVVCNSNGDGLFEGREFDSGYQDSTVCSFNSCLFNSNRRNGLRMHRGRGFAFHSCTFEGNTGHAIILDNYNTENIGNQLNGLTNISFHDCWVETNNITDVSHEPRQNADIIVTGSFQQPARNISFYNLQLANSWDLAVDKTTIFFDYAHNCMILQPCLNQIGSIHCTDRAGGIFLFSNHPRGMPDGLGRPGWIALK